MNILADKQQKMLDPNISEKERTIRTKEFYELYYRLREKEENSVLERLSLKDRKRLHKLVLFIYIVKNRLGGFRYEILNNKRTSTSRPIIFAITHVGKFDIEVVSEALRDHFYLLSGDYEHIQGTLDAPFLAINGVIYFCEKVKSDRIAVSDRMIEHLKSGGNLMYFPEGTWNLSPNLPVLPCYWGIVEIAQKSNAIIVPVAAEQYSKRFKINIGQNFDMNDFAADTLGKTKAINCLRDTLATLKWEIWESETMLKHKNMVGDEWDKFVSARLSEWPYFNLEYINDMIFRPKGISYQNNVFEHLSKLQPSPNNAFLFNRRNHN